MRLTRVTPAEALRARLPGSGHWNSRPEQGGRYAGDAVGAGAGGDDDRAEQVVTDLISKPGEVTYRAVVDRPGELDLDRNDPPVATLDDQIDLALASL